MFVLGLFMIFSASSVQASLSGEPYYYFVRQAIIIAGCFIASLFVISTPFKVYKKMSLIFVIAVIALLVGVYLYGAVINKARSWIPLGFFNLQPSEFAKTAIIIYMASYYDKYKHSKNLIVITIPLLAAAAMCALTFIQPDFGTTFIIVIILVSIFYSVPFDKAIK